MPLIIQGGMPLSQFYQLICASVLGTAFRIMCASTAFKNVLQIWREQKQEIFIILEVFQCFLFFILLSWKLIIFHFSSQPNTSITF